MHVVKFRWDFFIKSDSIFIIQETVEHQVIEELVIFDTEEKNFYPIDDATTLQIGDYCLDIEYENSEYKIDINYIGN